MTVMQGIAVSTITVSRAVIPLMTNVERDVIVILKLRYAETAVSPMMIVQRVKHATLSRLSVSSACVEMMSL
jgi:hypothetical protein